MSEPIKLFTKPEEHKPTKWEAMYLPKGSIERLREVADWARTKPGYTVPHITAEGLLLRVDRRGIEPGQPEGLETSYYPHSQWYNSGRWLVWVENEFDWEYDDLNRFTDEHGQPISALAPSVDGSAQ